MSTFDFYNEILYVEWGVSSFTDNFFTLKTLIVPEVIQYIVSAACR